MDNKISDDGWISTYDMLPAENVSVLLFDGCYKVSCHDGVSWIENDSQMMGHELSVKSLAYWRPLPPTPSMYGAEHHPHNLRAKIENLEKVTNDRLNSLMYAVNELVVRVNAIGQKQPLRYTAKRVRSFRSPN